MNLDEKDTSHEELYEVSQNLLIETGLIDEEVSRDSFHEDHDPFEYIAEGQNVLVNSIRPVVMEQIEDGMEEDWADKRDVDYINGTETTKVLNAVSDLTGSEGRFLPSSNKWVLDEADFDEMYRLAAVSLGASVINRTQKYNVECSLDRDTPDTEAGSLEENIYQEVRNHFG